MGILNLETFGGWGVAMDGCVEIEIEEVVLVVVGGIMAMLCERSDVQCCMIEALAQARFHVCVCVCMYGCYGMGWYRWNEGGVGNMKAPSG